LGDVILELKERFQKRYWVCAGSNAAIDVLAAKFVKRKGQKQALHYYPIRLMFDERLTDNVSQYQQLTIETAGAGTSSTSSATPAQAIVDQLQLVNDEQRLLSLEATIRDRMQQQSRPATISIWPIEKEQLNTMLAACQTRSAVRVSTNQSIKDMQKAEEKLLSMERKARNSRSTPAACPWVVLYTFSSVRAPSRIVLPRCPTALIMDEGSQVMEALAVFALLRVIKAEGDHFQRALIIGDHHQLPPTTKAPRNPFRDNTQMSLVERLMKSGFPHVQLKEQFRMHPIISRIVNSTIYGNTLRGAELTRNRPEVAVFQNYIQAFAAASNVTDSLATSSVVIVPSEGRYVLGKPRHER